MQNLQIFLRGLSFVAAIAEPIVGDAEPRRRKQILAIGVVGERARLPHQLVDDVPIVDRVLIAADQSRHRIHELIRVPDLDAIGVQPGFHGVANEPTVYRIDAAMKVNQTAGVDAAAHLQATGESRIGQRAERANSSVTRSPRQALRVFTTSCKNIPYSSPLPKSRLPRMSNA